jgi:hypothetical protein
MCRENKLWIVSNYNQDPSDVIKELDADFLIFDQGDSSFVPSELQIDGQYRRSFHSGHNISDYLQYIIENYHNLPATLGFIKGNLFPRHISKQAFLSRREEKGFVPLYSDVKTFDPSFHRLLKTKLVAQQVAPGYYLEISNNWYCKHRNKGKYFPKLEDVFQKFFKRAPPKYVPFVPGACMIVPEYKITRWPLEYYEEIYEAVTYDFFPVEAFHVERSMLYLFDFPCE